MLIEDHFQSYSQRFKGAISRVPSSLEAGSATFRRMLIVGSCLSEHVAHANPFPNDHILFNGGVLEDLAPAADYDFQIAQIPLRCVLGDATLWRVPYGDLAQHEMLLDECKRRLAQLFSQFTKHGREHGWPVFVTNFLVPTQNSNGRLLRHYDVRNIQCFVGRLNEALEELCSAVPNCYVLDMDSIGNAYGKRFYTDEFINFYSHDTLANLEGVPADVGRLEAAPPPGAHFEHHPMRTFCRAILADALAMYATWKQSDQVKMIVVDLDDTLWRGISGEMDRVETAQTSHRHLRCVPMTEGWPLGVAEALMYCRKRGILLGIISKNDGERISKIFPQAFGGNLSLDDFAVVRINWKSKPDNMAEILRLTNLLPESVVYIDDSPIERQAMHAAFPCMRILGRYFHYTRAILLWSPETQVSVISDEARRRTEMVRSQVRREIERESMSEAEFLESLSLSLTLYEIDGAHHPKFARALELINKTNQWNSTARKTDAATLDTRLRQKARMFGFCARDRFTDYGDVGFLLCEGARVAQFVMSCRVIGLQLEMAALRELMVQLGTPSLEFDCVTTDRNGVVRRFFEAHCVQRGGRYTLSAEALPTAAHVRLDSLDVALGV